jgi:hypothetical protein
MRVPHVIAIFAIAILAVGSRLFLFPPKSEAIFFRRWLGHLQNA